MSKQGPNGRLFRCRRHDGGLLVSQPFCGQSWLRAQAAKDVIERMRLEPCVGCRTGQRNAQATPTEQPKATRVWERWSVK